MAEWTEAKYNRCVTSRFRSIVKPAIFIFCGWATSGRLRVGASLSCLDSAEVPPSVLRFCRCSFKYKYYLHGEGCSESQWFLFNRTQSFFASRNSKLLVLHIPQDKCATIPQNFVNSLPVDTAEHPRRLEYSAAPLWELQVSRSSLCSHTLITGPSCAMSQTDRNRLLNIHAHIRSPRIPFGEFCTMSEGETGLFRDNYLSPINIIPAIICTHNSLSYRRQWYFGKWSSFLSVSLSIIFVGSMSATFVSDHILGALERKILCFIILKHIVKYKYMCHTL